MTSLKMVFKVLLCATALLSTAESLYAYSPKYFRQYRAKISGFENRLTLKNILDLTAMSSSKAQQLLIKAGYEKDQETGAFFKGDHYAHYNTADVPIYMVNFNKEKNATGFKNIIIAHQPEMRIIQTAFLAGGYTETRVIPRKGARWTKIYRKKGYPTYSISMLLIPNMNARALSYNFHDYIYCLICEKR